MSTYRGMPDVVKIPGLLRGRHVGPITRHHFRAEAGARYSWVWDEHKRFIAEQKAAGTYDGLMSSGYATNGFARDLDDWEEEFNSLPAALRSDHDSEAVPTLSSQRADHPRLAQHLAED